VPQWISRRAPSTLDAPRESTHTPNHHARVVRDARVAARVRGEGVVARDERVGARGAWDGREARQGDADDARGGFSQA
jgi:hypothetical protein